MAVEPSIAKRCIGSTAPDVNKSYPPSSCYYFLRSKQVCSCTGQAPDLTLLFIRLLICVTLRHLGNFSSPLSLSSDERNKTKRRRAAPCPKSISPRRGPRARGFQPIESPPPPNPAISSAGGRGDSAFSQCSARGFLDSGLARFA